MLTTSLPPRITPAELRRSALSPAIVATACLIIFLPTMIGVFSHDSYALSGPIEFFGLMLRNVVPLTFPILVACLYLPRLSDEFANGFTTSVRTRTPLRRYLLSRMMTSSILAFATFSLMIVVTWFTAFVIDPLIGWNSFPDLVPTGAVVDDVLYPERRATFTQLYADPPVLYGAAYALWVGVNAALYAAFGTLCLVLVGNRFVALAVPAIFDLVTRFVLQALGLEEWTMTASVFPFSITQQPIWTPVVPTAALALLCLALWRLAVHLDFDTPGLD